MDLFTPELPSVVWGGSNALPHGGLGSINDIKYKAEAWCWATLIHTVNAGCTGCTVLVTFNYRLVQYVIRAEIKVIFLQSKVTTERILLVR